jgi:putative heme-binding domain-containing protein
MNGIPRWTFADDGAGYKGTRVRHDPKDPKTAFDLIASTEKHFRPVDPIIGPDGALWFGDWANPLIGHMQYSQRDPNRDHQAGRIYRLVYKDKPLLNPVTQFGKPTAEVLDQLKEYEWRTRYRARSALRDRPSSEVLPAVQAWAAKLDPNAPAYDRLRCEALWVQEGFHAVDAELLKQVLASKVPDARAAAVRIVADERDRIPNSFDLLKAAALDDHPRVRTEALRGLSFFPTPEAATAVLASSKKPGDYYTQYTGDAALAANISAWRPAYVKGELAKGDPDAKRLLDAIIATDARGAQAVPYLQILLGKDPSPAEQRNKAMQALADMKGGNAANGRLVFQRNCTACHQVDGVGAAYGPAMDRDVDGKGPVGKRLTKFKIVESIIDPNADVDMKYLSTKIDTADGKSISGLVVSETKEEVVIFDGKEKKTVKVADIESRKTLKQSSMPEGLAAVMAPTEFLDVLAYLASLK